MDSLEKEMATHFSILAWETSWLEEPDRLVHGVAKSWTRLSNLTITVPVCQHVLSCTPRWLGLGFGKTRYTVNRLKSKHILMTTA